ncbi:MAG: hypothetical protein A2X32_06795 [Elusimicrobia bacterium GWC2_64_44]|nr:MAG: hypothetical protein A2X32_06795 [Elusimicrobia bacterium GWC2_64_44]
MKKKLILLLALLLPAALCLPAFAEDAAAPAGETAAEDAPKPAAKKPAPKKKAKKKKKPAPVSEYKFNSVDKTETYKFDRKANPILKPAKKKAAPKKAAPKKAPDSVGVGGDASGAAPDVN